MLDVKISSWWKIISRPVLSGNLSELLVELCSLLCLVCGVVAMIRFLDISWYFELTMYLQLSGKLNKYINFTLILALDYISMFLSFVLALVQLIIWVKQMKIHSHLSGFWAKSGEYFLALYSFVCRSYFSLQWHWIPKQFLPKATTSRLRLDLPGKSSRTKDNNPVSQTRY